MHLGCKPLHSEGKVVHPKSDVVEGGAVHSLLGPREGYIEGTGRQPRRWD